MLSYFVPAIAVAFIVSGISCARSDDIPTLDVRPVCRGIASQSELEAGLQKTNFEQCVQSEQAVREQVKKEWSTFSTADKSHCVALANTGGESSYTELITCLEMARDVRALRSAETASSRATTSQTTPMVQPAPADSSTSRQPSTKHRQSNQRPPAATQTPSSSSTPTVQPAPADSSASGPSSTTEPPKVGVDTTLLKQLQQAKMDAVDAKVSEQAARRKLADTEADLRRAKDEAGRATKEAEQARADAQAARESQAKAENKLADAEAARRAAEERLKASESAAKNQRGFGARLRGWFGHKPSNP
jgi:hypothetical protein